MTNIVPLENFNNMPRFKRLMGFDLGTKTIGLALSDVERCIATSLETIRRTKFRQDAQRIIELSKIHDIGGFVIGLPLNMDGSEGPRAQATRAFVRNLAQLTPIPVVLWDERLSTVAVTRALLEADTSRAKRSVVVDKVAATYILQGVLDRLSFIANHQEQ